MLFNFRCPSLKNGQDFAWDSHFSIFHMKEQTLSNLLHELLPCRISHLCCNQCKKLTGRIALNKKLQGALSSNHSSDRFMTLSIHLFERGKLMYRKGLSQPREGSLSYSKQSVLSIFFSDKNLIVRTMTKSNALSFATNHIFIHAIGIKLSDILSSSQLYRFDDFQIRHKS